MRETCVLILDDRRTSLGSLSLELVRHQIRVVYSNDLDELTLLSHEPGNAGVVVLAPNDVALELIGTCEKRLEIPPSHIVPVGSRPQEGVVEMFRTAGISWHLWPCRNAEDVRYVLNAAVCDLDQAELRLDARAPCSLAGRITLASELEESVVVVDVAEGGVGTLWQRLPAVSAPVQVAFRLNEQSVKRRARVSWARASARGEWRAGLAFRDPDQRTEQLIRSAVSDWLKPHRLESQTSTHR